VYEFRYATVIDRPRKAIHVVYVDGAPLEIWEIDDIVERVRQRMLARHGEQDPDVVIVQGSTKEDLRLFGMSASTSRVRAAMFHAALRWSRLALD
jgi:hypothetical protein